MPRASVNNKKMTNIALTNGEHVMGIRKNPEDETYGDTKLAGDAMEMPIGRPLRYTPGLKCDAHLESLRPERAGNHRAIQVCSATVWTVKHGPNNCVPMLDNPIGMRNTMYLISIGKFHK